MDAFDEFFGKEKGEHLRITSSIENIDLDDEDSNTEPTKQDWLDLIHTIDPYDITVFELSQIMPLLLELLEDYVEDRFDESAS